MTLWYRQSPSRQPPLNNDQTIGRRCIRPPVPGQSPAVSAPAASQRDPKQGVRIGLLGQARNPPNHDQACRAPALSTARTARRPPESKQPQEQRRSLPPHLPGSALPLRRHRPRLTTLHGHIRGHLSRSWLYPPWGSWRSFSRILGRYGRSDNPSSGFDGNGSATQGPLAYDAACEGLDDVPHDALSLAARASRQRRQSTAEVGRRRRRPAPARCVVESRHSTASPPHHYRRLPETHRARRAKQIARPALHRLSSSPTEAAPHRHGSSAFVRFSAGIHRIQRSSTITGSPHQRRSRGSARTASAAGRVRSPVATRRSRTWRWRARAASGCR